jgi:YggT family protein
MSATLISLIDFIFGALTLLILLDVIISWVVALRVRLPGWGYDVLNVIHRAANIFLQPIRRLIPNIGGLDISPIIALIVLDLLRRVIITALIR